MADENLEGLEGLDDFGDDFGDQLDTFMEGDEEEGDSELDSFFEDLSTIDDLEIKEEELSEPEATPEEPPAEGELPVPRSVPGGSARDSPPSLFPPVKSSGHFAGCQVPAVFYQAGSQTVRRRPPARG